VTPRVASARRYLRSGLPAIYQEGDFGMRFVGGLEPLLDPIVGLLDALPAHFDPELAPRPVLDLLAAWLGVETEETMSLDDRRELVRVAAELARRRGTKAGIELALRVSFPGLPFRVEDGGGVSVGDDGAAPPKVFRPSFVVYCDAPLPAERQAAVARLIERIKPVNAAYRLRVKAKGTLG
jgi:phage tail-like protein